MILIACVDNNFGLLFHGRRQSQDRVLREKILSLTADGQLWMNQYSALQFASMNAPQLRVSELFLDECPPDGYCFIENKSASRYISQVKQVYLFRWNRNYPSDFWFDWPLINWHLLSQEEFSGSSHEKITFEVYCP